MALIANIGGNGALFVGEDKIFDLEVLTKAVELGGVPVDITTMVIHFVVRLRDNTVDPPIFDKVASIVGVFNAVRALNTQRARVVLTSAELKTVTSMAYRHSWKRMDNGYQTVIARGDFTPEKATAS